MGLIQLITSPWSKYFAVVALIAGFLLWFADKNYDRGYAAAVADHQAEIVKMQIEVDEATEETRRQASDLENYRDAARMLAMESDNEILADGNACVPTPDELRRARDRWQSQD